MQLKALIEQWINEAIGETNRSQVPILFQVSGSTLFIISPISAYLVGPNGSLIDKYTNLLKQYGFKFYIKMIDMVPGKIEEIKL